MGRLADLRELTAERNRINAEFHAAVRLAVADGETPEAVARAVGWVPARMRNYLGSQLPNERDQAAQTAGFASWRAAIRDTMHLPAAEVADHLGMDAKRVRYWRRALADGPRPAPGARSRRLTRGNAA